MPTVFALQSAEVAARRFRCALGRCIEKHKAAAQRAASPEVAHDHVQNTPVADDQFGWSSAGPLRGQDVLKPDIGLD